MPHTSRRFPEEVDFVTSPGYVGGRDGRERLGLHGGPDAVITDKAVLRFDGDGEMYVESLHPGVIEDTVRNSTGWELRFASDLTETDPPTEDEIGLIRNDLDPDGVYTG